MKQTQTPGERRFNAPWRRLAVLVMMFVVFGYIGVRALAGVRLVMERGIEFEPGYLVLSWVVHLASIFLAALVWSHMLRRLDVTPGYPFNLRVFGVSMLARKIPGTIWYALSRLAIYRYAGWPARPVIVALGIELVTHSLAGLVVFVIGASLGLAAHPWMSRYVFSPYILVAALLFVGLAVWLQPIIVRKVMERRQGEGTSIEAYDHINIGDSLIWLTGICIVLFASAGMIYLLLLSIDVQAPFVVVLSGFALAVALGPIAVWMPADIGLKDGFLYLLLTPFLTEPVAALAVLLIRLWVSLLEVLFGLICAMTFGRPMLQEVFRQERERSELDEASSDTTSSMDRANDTEFLHELGESYASTSRE